MKFSELNKKNKVDSETQKNFLLKENKIIEKKEEKENEQLDVPQVIQNSEKIIENNPKTISNVEKKDIRFTIKRKEKIETKQKEEIFNFDEDIVYHRSMISYSQAMKYIFEFYKNIDDQNYLSAYDRLKLITEVILKELDNLYFLNFINYFTPRDYLYSHTLNTAILSAFISKTMGYEEEKIRNIVISALCIDCGMLKYRDLYSLERVFDKDEVEIIKSHINDGIELVDKIFAFELDLKEFVKKKVYYSHERNDGSGYMKFKGDEIPLEAQIISIADFYEALTHPRSYRDAYEKPLVMRMFLTQNKNLFNLKVMKALMGLFGLYPPQSIIKLSTSEIAKVLIVNKEKPTRPIVKVIADGNFNLVKPYVINLVDWPLTLIEGYVSKKEVINNNPELYRKEMLLWMWIEW